MKAVPIHGWILLIAFTALSWIAGVLVRAGYLRSRAKVYLNPRLPRWTRHSPIYLIPAACGLTSMLIMVLLAQADSSAKWLFYLLTVAFAVWTVVVSFRAPDFLKPRWLRQEEQRRARRVRVDG